MIIADINIRCKKNEKNVKGIKKIHNFGIHYF